MVLARCIPLNPCDYLYYAHHCMIARTTGGGNIAYMMMEADGHAEPERVRAALTGAMLAHPVTMARLKTSISTGWPHWKLPANPAALVQDAAAQVHVYEDLRNAEDWQRRLEQLTTLRFAPQWDLEAGLLIRLEQYALPGRRTRFYLRWPHCLMDAEGAQWFLAEIERHDPGGPGLTSPPGLPDGLVSDDGWIDPLAGRSLIERLRLFRAGLGLQGDFHQATIRPIAANGRAPLESFGALHRHWDAAQVAQLQTLARQCTPPGPALYARYLLACVMRAQDRLYSELGLDTDGFLTGIPWSLALLSRRGDEPWVRPVPGNYLCSPSIYCRRGIAKDKRALAEDIHGQLDRYLRDRSGYKQWAMLWAASWLRASCYQLIFKLPMGFNLTTGFSYYGEIARRLQSIGGAQVTNLMGAGSLGTPPGWNPTFSRFQEKLNLALAWNRPAISDEHAHRYAALIEEQMFSLP